MGVAADEQRAVVPLLRAVVADRLRGREDVRLVERGLQAGAAVPAGAERDLLVDVVRVGDPGVVRRDEVRDVDQVAGLGGLSRAGLSRFGRSHLPIMAVTGGRQQGASEPRRYPAAVRKLTWTRKPAWLRVQPVPGRSTHGDDLGHPGRRLDAELWSPSVGDEPLPLLISHDGPEMDKLADSPISSGRSIADGAPRRRCGSRCSSPASEPPATPPTRTTPRRCAITPYPGSLETAPSDRRPVLMGASLGALAALHAEWTHRGTFAGLFLESGSLLSSPDWTRRSPGSSSGSGSPTSSGRVLTAVAAPTSVPMSIVFGSSEENAADNRCSPTGSKR